MYSEDALPPLPRRSQVPESFSKVWSQWHSTRKLWYSLFQQTKPELLAMALLLGVTFLCQLLTPVILYRLLETISKPSGPSLPRSLALALGLVCMQFLQVVSLQHYYLFAFRGVQRASHFMTGNLFHKFGTLKACEARKLTGAIQVHAGDDVDNIADAFWIALELIHGLVLIAGMLVVLTIHVGILVWGPLITLALLFPLYQVLSKRCGMLERKTLKMSGQRLSCLSDLFKRERGVRGGEGTVAKFRERGVRGGEGTVAPPRTVEQVFAHELRLRRKLALTESLTQVIASGTGFCLAASTFALLYAFKRELDAPLVFTCLSVFVTIEQPFTKLGMQIRNLAASRVSGQRLQEFFSREEEREIPKADTVSPGTAPSSQTFDDNAGITDWLKAAAKNHWGAFSLGISLVLLTLLSTLTPVVQNWVISHFIKLQDDERALFFYFSLGALALGLFGLQHIFWRLVALRVGRNVFTEAVRAILGRPSCQEEGGALLSRFSSDLSILLNTLPRSLNASLRSGFIVISSCGLVLAFFPSLLFLMAPTVVLFYFVQSDYRRKLSVFRRLYFTFKAQRFAHFSQNDGGCFLSVYASWQRAHWGLVCLNRWFMLRVALLSSAVSVASVIFLVFAIQGRKLDAAYAGLVLVNSFQFWGSLSWCIRHLGEAEAKLPALGRLQGFDKKFFT